MTPRRHNRCVYTGPVGARMRPRPCLTPKRPVLYQRLTCTGGPLHGQVITLERNSEFTLTFTLHGQTGRYVQAVWNAAA
jgi:hypothetical protein